MYMMWVGLTMFVGGVVNLVYAKDKEGTQAALSVFVLVMGALLAFAGAGSIGAQ